MVKILEGKLVGLALLDWSNLFLTTPWYSSLKYYMSVISEPVQSEETIDTIDNNWSRKDGLE